MKELVQRIALFAALLVSVAMLAIVVYLSMR
jgi:hypothetical protein